MQALDPHIMSAWHTFDREELVFTPIEDRDGFQRWVVFIPAGPARIVHCGPIAGDSRIWVRQVQGEPENVGDLDFAEEIIPSGNFSATTVELEADSDYVVMIGAKSPHDKLSVRHPRGRWRSSMTAMQSARHYRLSMIGLAPVYGDISPPVGPFHPSYIQPAHTRISVRASLHQGLGNIMVHAPTGLTLAVQLEDNDYPLIENDPGKYCVQIPDVQPWFPHTHGAPKLYSLSVHTSDQVLWSSQVGFAHYTYSEGALHVNDQPVYVRGTTWVPLDAYTLGASCEQLDKALDQVVSTGANMVRITGTLACESFTFWQLCARKGLMVWNDLMTATFDPPCEPEMVQAVADEITYLWEVTAGNPALAVVCGGSETHQQAEMVAATDTTIELVESIVPKLLGDVDPNTLYVPSTPYKFFPSPAHSWPREDNPEVKHIDNSSGVSHYFAVGGYCQPMDTVRHSGVVCATESLAFAVPPVPWRVDQLFDDGAAAAGHHPQWKQGVPRDRGSSWDFDDIRDHYVQEIFGVNPMMVRRVDGEKYVEMGRIAVAEVMANVLGYWRSSTSECHTSLILSNRDCVAGAGWGVVDSDGVPKSSWYSASRVWAQEYLHFDNRGLDGLYIELCSDKPQSIEVELAGVCAAGNTVHSVKLTLDSGKPVSVDAAWGHFVDAAHQHRFGPASLSYIYASCEEKNLCSTWWIQSLADTAPHTLGLSAAMHQSGDDIHLEISTDKAARYVRIDCPGYIPSDNWFDLPHGQHANITLRPAWGTQGSASFTHGPGNRAAAAAKRPRPVVTAWNALEEITPRSV